MSCWFYPNNPICIKCKSTSDKRGPERSQNSLLWGPDSKRAIEKTHRKIPGSRWSGHRTSKNLAPKLTCTKGFLRSFTSCSFPAPRFHENQDELERSKARWSQRNWSWKALRAVSADPKMNAQWLQLKGARLQGVQLRGSANTQNSDHRYTVNLSVAACAHTHKILFLFFSTSSDTACSSGRSWLPGLQLREAFGALHLSPSVGEVLSAAPEMPGVFQRLWESYGIYERLMWGWHLHTSPILFPGLGFGRGPMCLTQRQEILNLGVWPWHRWSKLMFISLTSIKPQQAINIRCLFSLSPAKSLEGTATLPSEALHTGIAAWPVEQRQRKTGGEWIQWMVVAHGNQLKEAVGNHFVWSWLVTLWQSMQKTTCHCESKSC